MGYFFWVPFLSVKLYLMLLRFETFTNCFLSVIVFLPICLLCVLSCYILPMFFMLMLKSHRILPNFAFFPTLNCSHSWLQRYAISFCKLAKHEYIYRKVVYYLNLLLAINRFLTINIIPQCAACPGTTECPDGSCEDYSLDEGERFECDGTCCVPARKWGLSLYIYYRNI